MKSFEERRTDYFQKLRKFSEVIMKLSKEKNQISSFFTAIKNFATKTLKNSSN